MNRLTEKDKEQGRELYEILEMLSDEDKKQVFVYVRALHDRCVLVEDEKVS